MINPPVTPPPSSDRPLAERLTAPRPAPRTWLPILWCVAVLMLLLGRPCPGAAVPVAGLSATQRAWIGRAVRRETNGWIQLRLQGEARERGFQHGYLLAREIEQALRVRRAVWQYESGMEWPWLVAQAGRFLVPKVEGEWLAEIEGLAEGLEVAGVPSAVAELVTFNAYFELAWYWWPQTRKTLPAHATPPPKQACSAFIATGSFTANGQIVLGHNTMFDYPLADANVLLDITPALGHRILMQAFPGWIHSGTDFFITSAGLVGAETTIGDFAGFDESGVPEFVRMRRATQYAQSIDEWCSLMRQDNNGGYANAWLLGDIHSGEIARLELGLRHTALERTRDGLFPGSNVAENLQVLRLETDRNELDIRHSSVARRERWKTLVRQYRGRIDEPLGRRFLADHYDSYYRKVRPGARSLCGHSELDPRAVGTGTPFSPLGTIDAKVVDAALARRMSFTGRWGSACGRPFDAPRFLQAHPQFEWMEPWLRSRPSRPWTRLPAGFP